MSEYDKTLEQACKEAKKQRKEDERKGYMRAVRRMGKFIKSYTNYQNMWEEDILEELKKMGKSC